MCICSFQNQVHPYQYVTNKQAMNKLVQNFKVNLDKRMIHMAGKNFVKAYIQKEATTIFTNGIIYTMEQEKQTVQAVALRFNQILQVGPLQKIMKLKGPQTHMIDLQGKVMLPGFIDPHIHMSSCILDHWLDLGPFVNKTLQEVKDRLINAIKQADDKYILGAQLFDPQITQGIFDYSRKGLDELSDKIGIFILQANGHVAHVNSAALKMAGIDQNTPDPLLGRLIRDKNGNLTGQVQQSAVNLFSSKFPHFSNQQYQINFKKLLDKCASKGCTSLNDCGIGFLNAKADLSVLYQVFSQQNIIRYSGFLVSSKWKEWAELKMKPNYQNADLKFQGIKCWVDGSTQAGSAFLRQEYQKKQWGRGKPNYTKEQLKQSVQLAHNNNWQVGVHANGDAAIDMALDVFEQVQNQNPKKNMRHRIQHSTICSKQQLFRMKKLDIYPSFLIGHVYYYGKVFLQILGKKRQELIDPVKTAFDFGLKPSLHSDYNCQPVSPLRCIYNAVTRKMRADKSVLNQKQCITPFQAIQAVTINAAFQCHSDEIVGTIKEGKFADFVVLNQDPMTIDPNKIKHIKVLQTWMNGKKTYTAPVEIMKEAP